jgi:hypothetical protein
MKKYNIIRNIAFVGFFLFAFSCKQDEFLDTMNKTTLTDATMWSSEANADIFLDDVYHRMEQKGNSPENLDNFTSDNDAGAYYSSWAWKKGIITSSGPEGLWNGSTAGPMNLQQWSSFYQSIRKVSTFLYQVNANKSHFSTTWYNKRMDEARFLRAYFYSELFTKVGGVVLITTQQNRLTQPTDSIYLPRSSFEETFNFIVSELASIVDNGYLEVKYNNGDADAGRVTLGAAQMLKGWIQLFGASPAYNSDDPAVPRSSDNLQAFADYKLSRWADAAKTNKDFIDKYGPKGSSAKKYDLFTPMSKFWNEANEYNSEVVWDRQQKATTMAQTYDTYGGPTWIAGIYYTWGNYDPTQELVDEYQMANGLSPYNSDGTVNVASGFDEQHPYVGREKRFYDFIIYDGAPYKQDWMKATDTIYTRIDKVHPSKNEIDFGSSDVSNTGYYFKKRLDNAHPSGGNLDGRNYVYYRYAEVLLNYAEAQNEAAGPDQSVYDAINAIRTRPGTDLPPYVLGSMTQDQMRTAIKHERRIELVFEGHRLYDLWRWKDAMTEMNKDLHGMKITNSSPTDNKGVWVYQKVSLNHPHVFTQKMYFCPVQQSAMDQNPKLIQNWGSW